MKLPTRSLSCAVLLLAATLTAAFGQSPETTSEDARRAELRKRVIDLLQLRPGDTVADVGCGDGAYTIPLARRATPKGKVFAVDIDATALSKLRKQLLAEGVKNVRVIKGTTDDPKLGAANLDAALIVNAYHEMTRPRSMLRRVMAALKPGGLLVLVERIGEIRETKSRAEQTRHHELAAPIAKRELEKAGFEIVTVRDPFAERPPDSDGKSRWWAIVARKPAGAAATR